MLIHPTPLSKLTFPLLFLIIGGGISNEEVVSKVSIIFLPIYAIRVSTIQEFIDIPCNDLTLDDLVGSLSIFELINYDNSVPEIQNH